MRERPIIFSGPMVRAILDGRKSQTRRVARLTYGGHLRKGHRRWHPGDPEAVLASPYGVAGDRLWVRETWAPGWTFSGSDPCVFYRAEGPDAKAPDSLCWRPSIHMPRWASRLTLEITEVRVQRLQEISEEDAKAEGVEAYVIGHGSVGYHPETLEGLWDSAHFREGFAVLWDSIQLQRKAPSGLSWADNPWVWVITFSEESSHESA